jgi:hypothetical protein
MANLNGLKAINDMPLRKAVGNRNFTFATFADVSGSAQVNVNATLTYCIDGKMYQVNMVPNVDITNARNDDGSTPVTAQAANTTCYYVLAVNTTGVVFGFKGTDDSTAVPTIPEKWESSAGTWAAVDLCPVCLMYVNTAAAWTLATNFTNTPTITYTTLSTLPASV